MGQAKQRGTFEKRRVEAIQREADRQLEAAAQLAAQKERQRLHDLAHPKQAAARRQRSHMNAMLMATLLSAATISNRASDQGAGEL